MIPKSSKNALICAPHLGFAHAKLRQVHKPSIHEGLTIVELLVAMIIMSLAILGATSIVNIGLKGLKSSETNYDVQNLIDRNMSEIESISDRYVCTSTVCSVMSATPNKDAYVDPTNSASWSSFEARCKQDDFPDTNGSEDLISPLADYIDTNVPEPTGVYREIQVHGGGTSGSTGIGRIKHMTVQYRNQNSSGLVLRNSTIIPTIVAYCP
jgi:type II secretory pathway pseudopilin PulG